jgi:hypothetical protein
LRLRVYDSRRWLNLNSGSWFRYCDCSDLRGRLNIIIDSGLKEGHSVVFCVSDAEVVDFDEGVDAFKINSSTFSFAFLLSHSGDLSDSIENTVLLSDSFSQRNQLSLMSTDLPNGLSLSPDNHRRLDLYFLDLRLHDSLRDDDWLVVNDSLDSRFNS